MSWGWRCLTPEISRPPPPNSHLPWSMLHDGRSHFSLASVYARIDRVPEAMSELSVALELNPGHYRANLLRGRILSLQGQSAGPLPNLQKAAQVEPRSVEAHLFLADAYEQVGRQDEASRERAEAQRLKAEAHP